MGTKTRLVGAAGALTVVGALAYGTLNHHEGLKTCPYYDSVKVLTICIGDTENVTRGKCETVDDCKKRLMRRLPDYEGPMRRCLKNPDEIPGKVYVAFLSLSYNIGTGAFCRSSVARAANDGDLYRACNNLMNFTKAGGRVLKGLVSRRKQERALCIDGIDEPVTLYPDERAK